MDPRMRARPREAHASPSPAVAANAEGDAIEVLESTDVLPMAPEDQHWKTLFDQFDPENSGYISTEQFRSLLNTHGSELDPHKLAVLLALADSNADGRICYQDFVNLMSNKRSNSFRRAILQGSRQRKSAALLEEPGLGISQRLVRHVAFETLPREMDRKWYYDSYTGCPPPWFIIVVTIVEVAVFVYYGLLLDRWVLQVSHPLYLRNPLVYHPQLRVQAWRYLSYIFMHAGIEHLSLNVLLQLLVGVPLEMVHGALRIGFLYISGVLAGSLAVSVADMTAPVVGSSGGVYALVSAHLANIVMNWSGMKCHFKLLRMGAALLCMSAEFGRAVWLRFYPSVYPPCPNPSFVAHLGGVAVGVTLGVVVLRNYEQRLQEQSLWWIFIFVYIVFVLFAVFWNIFAYSLLELRLPPLP
ncbi:rhomboid-related protein 3-like isoform X1 [Huso huso]|uniref:rhomboid protease n=1 Tax=Huso huso TaxID=61971 RepID=A0ABR0Z4N6_HUSHU